MKKFVLGFAFAVLYFNVIQSKVVTDFLEKKLDQFEAWTTKVEEKLDEKAPRL